ncbi:MAG: orotidine-5'-phosphate decarboxylase [Caldiserica bacterium]|jgi:orotidine-5'-phosphate decarboxylase|nr:orotidine-5'-phosphate decarboxylase [Caldisericota bacterium]MDH7562156.1 orotidine-5'-phosphate decarboxylase [Caldisericota bacterium]
MDENFADWLLFNLKKKDSLLCLGMDPVLDSFPRELSSLPPKKALIEFCAQILESVEDLVPVIKFQIACFERHGSEGIEALEEALRKTRKSGIISILDCKRGDIGTISEHYAEAYLSEDAPLGADAVTLNPFLGFDSVEPFLPFLKFKKGVFVLVRTSNPSAKNIQELGTKEGPLFLEVAKMVRKWGEPFIGKSGFSALGAVVAGNSPEELTLLRSQFPSIFFLVPGYGAQGATEKEVALAFDQKGNGAVINSSRQLIYAFQRPPYSGMNIKFWEATRLAYIEARDKLNQAIKERVKK